MFWRTKKNLTSEWNEDVKQRRERECEDGRKRKNFEKPLARPIIPTNVNKQTFLTFFMTIRMGRKKVFYHSSPCLLFTNCTMHFHLPSACVINYIREQREIWHNEMFRCIFLCIWRIERFQSEAERVFGAQDRDHAAVVLTLHPNLIVQNFTIVQSLSPLLVSSGHHEPTSADSEACQTHLHDSFNRKIIMKYFLNLLLSLEKLHYFWFMFFIIKLLWSRQRREFGGSLGREKGWRETSWANKMKFLVAAVDFIWN